MHTWKYPPTLAGSNFSNSRHLIPVADSFKSCISYMEGRVFEAGWFDLGADNTGIA
jgi:hypothetical protein